MAITADRVVVELEARLGRYEANVARAEQKFDRAMGGIQKSAGRTEAFVSRAAGVMSAALAGVSVLTLAKSFLTLADEAKNLDAQLRLATQASGSFGQAQEDVRRIATETRSGLKETADLYATFMRNARELGITQEQAARSTETITKAFTISGATAAEAAGGLRQFLQGIQSGTLRGEELNSVLENAPRLARALADGLGVTIGQLRAMGQEGELTGAKVIGALEGAAAQIDAEFRELPVTFDQAMTLVYNSALTVFGAFDEGGEFSTALANFITGGTEGFADMEDSARAFGQEVSSVLAGFTGLVNDAAAAVGALGDMWSGWPKQVIAELETIADYVNPITATMGLLRKGIQQLPGYQARQRNLQNTAGERALRDRMQGRDVFGNPIATTPIPSTPAAPAGGSRRRSGTSRAPRSPLNPEAFAREESALNDQILRLKADELTNTEERTLAELKRLQSAHTTATTDVQNDKRYTEAQKAQIVALMGTVNALEQARVLAERDITVARDALDIRMAGLRNQQDFLRNDADLADSREERRDVELRLLDLAYQMERAELEALIASKEASDAQKQIAQQRLAILGALHAGEKEGINRRFESPLERYRRELGDPDRTNDEVERAVIGELESVRDSISDGVQKALGVKNPILAALINSFIEQQLIKPLLEGVAGAGGMGGGIGGIIGAIGGFLGFASGGSMTVGGRGGTDKNVLSLNGRPIANVSRGETLNVGSKALGGRGGGTVVQPIIQVDARGAVMNDQFAAMILSQANQSAAQMVGSGMSAINKGIPTRIAQFQRDGT